MFVDIDSIIDRVRFKLSCVQIIEPNLERELSMHSHHPASSQASS